MPIKKWRYKWNYEGFWDLWNWDSAIETETLGWKETREAQLWAGKMEWVWGSAVICHRSLNPKWQVWSMSGALLNMVRKLTKFIALCVKPPGKGINSHLVFKTGLTSHIWKLQESFIWHLARRMNLWEHWKRNLCICIELWLSNGSCIYFNI